MRLINLRIEDFKCIEDSNEFIIDQVTCLMGKNEAGKTAILESLYKLNPVEPDMKDFDELEYPRRFVTTSRASPTKANVLTTVWELDQQEFDLLDNAFGPGIVNSSELTITKGYDNKRGWKVQFKENDYINKLITEYKLDAAEGSRIRKSDSIKSAIEALSTLESPTEKQQALLEHLLREFPDKTESKLVEGLLGSFLPHFVYFDTYHKLPGRVGLTDLKNRFPNQLSFEDKIFLALLDMTSSDLEEIENTGKSEKLIMELEAIENSLSDHIFEYWTQNRHLEVKFLFDQARPEDPPPFNQGFVFNTRIKNTRHRASVNFDERSSGFIWFFSFLVWFSQMKKNYGENLFILLDEPGLSLHGRAQMDLLRYVNEKLRPYYQVIYTAHSPFMIDVKHIFSIRTVEDVVETSIDNGNVVEKIYGTKVGDQILSKDRDTLFPLQGVLGYDMAQTLFVGPYVLVVEGPTEFGLIHWFSRRLIERKEDGLDIRWAVCPAEGASKVSSFITLFKGRGLKIAALLDYHKCQKGIVDKLEYHNLLEAGHLLRTTTYAAQVEADIEDLIGWEMYAYLVNKALELPKHLQLPKKCPPDADIRVVKEVESRCRMLPPYFQNFDHYLPVKYLTNLTEKEIEGIPGLDEALNRFEQLFSDLNKLIS